MALEYIEPSVWREPVYIRIGFGASEMVEGPVVALDYLRRRWPSERGPAYNAAVIACQSAIEGKVDLMQARDDFAAAAREAYLLS
ncbi:DUF982 domain-containing protein [Neorhizobium alkalisoli]|uniref:Uncharacterized protein DUF982 n=1 Tax=Neorhizobium alkalisoli TaxID=528178 RepID=A0A561QUU3_9HYPH|nr:uncharacterized protein DUF982 [Neorhizobium alkalisoli]